MDGCERRRSQVLPADCSQAGRVNDFGSGRGRTLMPSKSISRRSFLNIIGGAALLSTGYLAERKLGWLYLRDAITFRYIPKEVNLDQLGELDREFDICIVGSGPAGVILAIDLARAGYNTLILESGFHPESEAYDERIDHLEVFH